MAGIVSGFVALAARRAAEGARARAEAEALLRLAGSSPVSAVLDSLLRVLSLEGAAVLHRADEGWRLEAASGDQAPASPEAAGTTIELDEEHVLALAGGPVRSEDRRVLEAFAKEIAASVELGELEAEAEAAGVFSAASELRAALLSAVSHDLRTPIAAIKASVTSLLQRDVDWTPEAREEFVRTIDEETDRLNALVGNLLDMSRLQAGALEVSAIPDRRRAGPARRAPEPGRGRRRGRARRPGIAAASSGRSGAPRAGAGERDPERDALLAPRTSPRG